MAVPKTIVIDFNSEQYSASSVDVGITIYKDRNHGLCKGSWSATGTSYVNTAITSSRLGSYVWDNDYILGQVSNWKVWSDDDPTKFFYLKLIKKRASGTASADTSNDFTDGEIIINADTDAFNIECCRSGITVSADTYILIESAVTINGSQVMSSVTSGIGDSISATCSNNNGLEVISSVTNDDKTITVYSLSSDTNCYENGAEVPNILYLTYNDDTSVYSSYDLVQRIPDISYHIDAEQISAISGHNRTTIVINGVNFYKKNECKINEKFPSGIDPSYSGSSESVSGVCKIIKIKQNLGGEPTMSYENSAITFNNIGNNNNPKSIDVTIGVLSGFGETQKFYAIQRANDNDTTGNTNFYLDLVGEADGASIDLNIESNAQDNVEHIVLGDTPYGGSETSEVKYGTINEKTYTSVTIPYSKYSFRVNAIYKRREVESQNGSETEWDILGQGIDGKHETTVFTTFGTSASKTNAASITESAYAKANSTDDINFDYHYYPKTMTTIDRPTSFDGKVWTEKDAYETHSGTTEYKSLTFTISGLT